RRLEEASHHKPSADQSEHIAATYNDLAWRLFLDGKAADGLADAEQAVRLNPGNASFLDTRGQIHLVLNRVEHACQDLQRATELGIEMPGTSYGLGRCLELQGDLTRATESYRKAVELLAVDDFGRSAQAKARERLESLMVRQTASPDIQK